MMSEIIIIKMHIHKIRKLVLVSYRYNNRYPGCTTRTSVPSQPTCLNILVSKKNKNKKTNKKKSNKLKNLPKKRPNRQSNKKIYKKWLVKKKIIKNQKKHR